jgi:hypothetical protein
MKNLYSALALSLTFFCSMEAQTPQENIEAVTLQTGEEEYQMGLKCFVDPNFKIEQAFSYFEAAAEKGHIRAHAILGQFGQGYESGEGIAQDDKEAFIWYKKAADQGYPYAQYQVGNFYKEGRGVDQDLNEACIWYKKAADQGHRPSQIKLQELGQTPQD